jgi:tetratricopeptide (TPR) repeat protein
LAANQKERQALLAMLDQRIRCDAGIAAYWSELYKESVDYFTQVLKDDKSPSFFDAKFGRAEAYLKLKDLDAARTDLADLSLRANTGGKFALYDKAQCMIGDLCLEAKDYPKAFAAFNIVAMMDSDSSANAQIAAFAKPKSESERLEAEKDAKDAAEWIEYAIYKTAFAAAKLGKTEDRDKMAAKYKKAFPSGRFIADIDKLPAPEGANKP